MKVFKTLDKREGLELNNKKALNKRNGEIFFSALSTFKNDKYPRWENDLLCCEITQKRTLNPITTSLTKTDKLYNEGNNILRVWLDITFIDDYYLEDLSEDFEILFDIWNPPYETILNKENLAIIDIPTKKIFKGRDLSKFNIIVFETIDINELPDYILKTIKNKPSLIYQYVIKNHKNEFIVDSNNNLIFRFFKIIFTEKPQDFLITDKKILNFSLPTNHFPYDLLSNLRISEGTKLITIMKRFGKVETEMENIHITYDNEAEYEENQYIHSLPFSDMYDNFLPQLNMLHCEKYEYDQDNIITTNGVFIHKPKMYRGERNINNVGICILFNKFGLVHRLEGQFDGLKAYREDLAREIRYKSDFETSQSSAKFEIDGKKISWKFYDPNSPLNSLYDEPKEYIKYDGEFHYNSMTLSSYVTYYDHTYNKFMKMDAFDNLIFNLYEV